MPLLPLLRKVSTLHRYDSLRSDTTKAKNGNSGNALPLSSSFQDQQSTPFPSETEVDTCAQKHNPVEWCARKGPDVSTMGGPDPFTEGRNNCPINFNSNQLHVNLSNETLGQDTAYTPCWSPEPAAHGRESSLKQTRNININNIELENKVLEFFESKARLEAEIKERTDLLRHIQGIRGEIVTQGEQRRRFLSFAKAGAMPAAKQASSYGSSRLETSSSSHSTPSVARQACNEAYARMTPTQRHLMKDKLHWDGIRERNIEEERQEHLEWERYQHYARMRPSDDRKPKTEAGRVPESKRDFTKTYIQTLTVKKQDNENRPHLEAWALYEASWNDLRLRDSNVDSDGPKLTFSNVPWPVRNVFISLTTAGTNNDDFLDRTFCAESISAFLFSVHHSDGKSKRQRLHDALLRYHPDRFDSRILHFVEETERLNVERAVRRVAGVLNVLLNKGS